MHGITGESLLAIEWTLVSVALVLILARLNLRLRLLGKRLVMSDFFILLSFVAALCLNCSDIILYVRGVYQPWLDYFLTFYVAPEDELVVVYREFYISYFPFYIEQYCNKFGLLGLYFEIFPRDARKLRVALVCLSLYCTVGFIVTMCMVFFACPWGCYWSLTTTCGNCQFISDNLGWAFHFSSDILVMLLPLIYLSQTNMKRAQKISASVTFAIGLVSITVSFARWIVVLSVFQGVGEAALTTAEALAVSDGHVGLIVAILPSLRPYLRIWSGTDLSAKPREITTGSNSGISSGNNSGAPEAPRGQHKKEISDASTLSAYKTIGTANPWGRT